MVKPYALVFGGGGTKGVYEIGVWQALRELDIPVNAVIGTSIGAINALLFAQKDFKGAQKLWSSIRFEDIFQVPQNAMVTQTSRSLLKIFSLMGKLYFKGKPLDPAPLKKMIEKYFFWQRLKSSHIDFGLVTFNLTNLAPMEVFIENMREETLVNFILASAAFPGFKETKIGQDSFLDGGVWDNVPVRSAIRRGYHRIIAVDVSGLGNNRLPNPEGLDLVYIKNSMDFGHILDFDPSFLRDFQMLGYLDTLRIFGGLEGRKYFIKDNHGFMPLWNRGLKNPDFHRQLKTLFPWMRDFQPRDYLQEKLSHHHSPALMLWECLAQCLNLPRIQQYQGQELLSALEIRLSKMEKKISLANVQKYTGFFQALGQEIKNPILSQALRENSPLELWFILQSSGFAHSHPKIFSLFYDLIPKLHGALIFLKLLTSSQGGVPGLKLKGRILLDLLKKDEA